jgi:dTDP-4-dehydrorhamnose reductase
MKVLILGAQGMLGHDLAKVFTEYKPWLWDKAELDITDEAMVREKITSSKPDIIINAAAYTNVDGAETDNEIALAINADAVGFIASTAKKINAKVVQISTEYVFSGENKNGYNETDRVEPINIYGQSKAEGEKLLIASGADYYLVRTSWLYGQAPQKGKPRGKNFIDTILAKAVAGEELKVVNDQYGKPTYTLDLAEGIKTMLWENYPPGIYHLVNESITTWFDLAKYALQIKHLNAKIKACLSTDFTSIAKRPQFSILNNNKFPQLRTWQQALEEYLNI